MTDYVLEYCDKVLNGEIIANKKIKLACQREIRDRGRVKDDDFNYYFDLKQANKAINFMALIPKTDGTKLEMALFQKWIVGSLYGWREKRTNNRRYNKAFISMARKNSKTYVASCIAIASLLLENKPAKNRQILFVSNALKQAQIGYNMVSSELRQVVKLSPSLRNTLDIKKKQITKLNDDSFVIACAGKAETLDGYNPTTCIIDEFHQAKDHSIYNVIKSGMGQQKNGLLCIVSTSGFQFHAMYEDYQIMNDILNQKIYNERQFIAIWELDDKAEINNKNKWIKANPLFEISAVKETMLENMQNDVDLARAQGDLIPVLVKNFNMWYQSTRDSFISHKEWQNAITEPIKPFKQDIIFGIDLSKSNDLTSVSWIIPDFENNNFYCDSHSWVATKYGLVEKMKQDNINYQALEQKGECDITTLESGVIDYQAIFEFIKNMVDQNNLNVLGVCYDPWSFGYLLGDFEKQDYPLIETAQNNKTLSFPTKQFKECLLNGQIKHSDNKLLSIAVDNAILVYDSTGQCRIDKTRANNKIDPVAALMNAWVFCSSQIIEGNDKANNEFYKSEEFSF